MPSSNISIFLLYADYQSHPRLAKEPDFWLYSIIKKLYILASNLFSKINLEIRVMWLEILVLIFVFFITNLMIIFVHHKSLKITLILNGY